MEAFTQRISSPVIGSIVLAFLIFNWEPIFFVVFAGDAPPEKFDYFHTNTNIKSLLVFPVITGVVFAIATPWIKFLAAIASEFPTRKLRLLQHESAHKILRTKNQLATERESERAIYEQSLINQAKRDQEIKEEITDESIKADLEDKIETSRSASVSSNSPRSTPDDARSIDRLVKELGDSELRILQKFSAEKSGKGNWSYLGNGGDSFSIGAQRVADTGNRKAILDVTESLSKLRQHHLIEYGADKREFLITNLGYEVVNHIKS